MFLTRGSVRYLGLFFLIYHFTKIKSRKKVRNEKTARIKLFKRIFA
jgi:hypothetical protein